MPQALSEVTRSWIALRLELRACNSQAPHSAVAGALITWPVLQILLEGSWKTPGAAPPGPEGAGFRYSFYAPAISACPCAQPDGRAAVAGLPKRFCFNLTKLCQAWAADRVSRARANFRGRRNHNPRWRVAIEAGIEAAEALGSPRSSRLGCFDASGVWSDR